MAMELDSAVRTGEYGLLLGFVWPCAKADIVSGLVLF